MGLAVCEGTRSMLLRDCFWIGCLAIDTPWAGGLAGWGGWIALYRTLHSVTRVAERQYFETIFMPAL